MAENRTAKKTAAKPKKSVGTDTLPEVGRIITEAEAEAIKAQAEAIKEMNLWQRISGVRGELKRIDYDKTVGEEGDRFSYPVATAQAVRAALRPLMAKYGLVDYIALVEMAEADTGVMRGSTAKRKLIQYQGHYLYTITNADIPEQTLSFPVLGYGDDAGDKGPGKSSTYAMKTGQKVLFQIDIGKPDDDEDRPQGDEPEGPPTISAEQIQELLLQADEYYGDDAPDVLQRMCDGAFAGYDVPAVKDIPAELFQSAKNLLKNQAIRDRKIEGEVAPDAV